MTKGKKSGIQPKLLTSGVSELGPAWIPVYENPVDFDVTHFETAMLNIIRQPNINSTVIMRADILKENVYDPGQGDTMFTSKLVHEMPQFPTNDDTPLLMRDLSDVSIRAIPDSAQAQYAKRYEIVRRIIPRNPFKDYIINQTCLMYTNGVDSNLVVYIPHIGSHEQTPYYLPPVYGIGVYFNKSAVSIHYLPFGHEQGVGNLQEKLLRSMSDQERPIRIALKLLATASKHSQGTKLGYEKRVNHDLVVPKVNFQNQYITLKKKYLEYFMSNWAESTDPRKHVFEDIAIAAFIIEYWKLNGLQPGGFEFRDLGCGNGLLVYILNQEGYSGKGIDARARKSWKLYPEEVQKNLLEQIIVPNILLEPHPSAARLLPPDHLSYNTLLKSDQISTTTEFPKNTFIIGNHSDELSCWIPLLGFPFMVIPCCSFGIDGVRKRYPPRKNVTHKTPPSTYKALVDHVEDIAILNGWRVEKEMLRIPSTRNAAIMSCEKIPNMVNEPEEITKLRVFDIIALEGGANGWVENCVNLMKKDPRSH
ncbi:tRNA (uracil-O(2)-)-methyltransferase [Candida viswanathii]|uniref:tRNA (uracil-O(2)-)-methyltransferase n=1 Tax=Candida viswanathii TaxID=5486 RepID=A0A367XQJ5_9ASCO|nr:tRNA (uracil-O(2)-)-methyltransferase [Candida viswanathii]